MPSQAPLVQRSKSRFLIDTACPHHCQPGSKSMPNFRVAPRKELGGPSKTRQRGRSLQQGPPYAPSGRSKPPDIAGPVSAPGYTRQQSKRHQEPFEMRALRPKSLRANRCQGNTPKRKRLSTTRVSKQNCATRMGYAISRRNERSGTTHTQQHKRISQVLPSGEQARNREYQLAVIQRSASFPLARDWHPA